MTRSCDNLRARCRFDVTGADSIVLGCVGGGLAAAAAAAASELVVTSSAGTTRAGEPADPNMVFQNYTAILVKNVQMKLNLARNLTGSPRRGRRNDNQESVERQK